MVYIKFTICACLILIAGKRVAKYADAIAEKTGLSGLWVGLILVSLATSLPELFTGISSVLFVNAPDLTVGNLLGANSYNLLNIVTLDLLTSGAPLLSVIAFGQLLTAVFSLIPVMLVIIAIILSGKGIAFSAGHIGIFSVLILISYCVATKVMYNFEKKNKKPPKEKIQTLKYNHIPLKRVYWNYLAASGVIVLCGIWLAFIGKELAVSLNLGESFIGNLFIGFATSLPEITVSVAALLLGAREIAVANMLGSNLFNMTVIFIDDILYRKGAILQTVSADHIISASAVLAMTAVVILAISTRSKMRFMRISWYVPVLLLIFLIGAYLNFGGKLIW